MARVLLLVPSASYRATDFVEAARALGVEVVVGSPEAHVLSRVMGPRALQVPLGRPEEAADAIVAHDRIAPLDAVVAVDDAGTVAAAVASQRLGLVHNPPTAVRAARDKQLMRLLLQRAEVPQPAFAVLDAEVAAEEAAALGVGFPCVVKPTTLSGSQGVIRADDPEQLAVAVRRSRAIATAAGCPASAPLLVERFVGGAEVAVEALLVDGELRVLAVFDKPDPLEGPYFEETIYVTPSRLPPADLQAALGALRQATAAMGLVDGPVHAEFRVGGGRAAVIEVAARTIGGLCSRTLAFGAGHSLEELVLAHALGRPVVDQLAGGAAGVLMLPIERAGTLVAVEGQEEAAAVEGIVAVQVTVPTGRPVLPLPEGDRYLGFVFARGAEPAAVEGALRRVQRLLRVRIE